MNNQKIFPTRVFVTVFGGLFVIQAFWNIYLYLQSSHLLLANYWFNVLYAVTPLILGTMLLFLVLSRRVGGEFASALGYLGTAAITFGLGLLFWAYYNVIVHVPVPHPSVGDAFFLIYPWLLVVGTIRLLRFYTPLLKWGVVVEAFVVFLIAAVPIYHYLIVPTLAANLMFLDKLNIYDTLIANAALLGVVYLLWRIGGGRLRTVLLIFSFSYIALSAGDFIFQYRTDKGLYWNGDPTDTLMVIHLFLLSLAVVYLLGSIFSDPVVPTPLAPLLPQRQ